MSVAYLIPADEVPTFMSQLPFLPFSKPTIDEDTIAAVGEVLRSGWITSGPKVQAFEAQLSEYFGGRPVRTFNSGTCTMEIALRIAGIGPGDEVITTPISWVATANVILEVGATPVFADIDPVTRNIDLDQVEAAITPRTKAIIPVNLPWRTSMACGSSKTRRKHWAQAGTASALARPAISFPSVFRQTRTSPPRRAAAWC